MREFSSKVENSEELRALALRFFSFDDNFFVERTQKFMTLSNNLRDLRDDVDEMIGIMKTMKPFRRLAKDNPDYNGLSGGYYSNIITGAREQVNSYSLETIFQKVLDMAL